MTEISFKGKGFVYNHHLAVPHRPLIADGEKSVGEANFGGNLIIQGDNLHALKSLLPVYAGKVDCIFIDPPYNTGNEGWSYNDRVNAPMINEWLKDNPIGIEDGLRHDKWCAMMWPRLKLLHELLSETGVIFICIDDNELERLKTLTTDIFGEENHLATFVWETKRAARGVPPLSMVMANHEYILCFAKTEFRFKGLERDETEFSNPDNDPRGLWRSESIRATGAQDNWFDIIEPKTSNKYSGNWAFSKNRIEEMIKENLIIFPRKTDGTPRQKKFIDSYLNETKALTTHLGWYSTENSTKDLMSIFNGNKVFNFPKPLELVEFFINQATNEKSIILDSFAGSGTTAHAVLKANKEDGGNRKFILVEMEEDIASPVTAERVRRVINGYSHDGKTTEGLGGAFTYCTLGEPIDLNRILSGVTLPSYEEIAPVLFYMATNETLKPDKMRPDDFYVGASSHNHVWMIYRPNLEWLKSDKAALSLSKAKEIFNTDPAKRHLVFAPARFVTEEVLKDEKINVAFVPFPDSLYQVVREER